MNFPLFVARRYFFNGKKKSFIQTLSTISMLGVGVGTMALIIVLSAFNGLEEVIRTMYNTFDPEIKITAAKGKSFVINASFLKRVAAVPGVAIVSEIAEDNALLKYRDGQMVVKIKGISDNFLQQNRLDSAIVAGKLRLHGPSLPYASVGFGIQQAMGIALNDPFDQMQIWYPKNTLKTGLNPENAFFKRYIVPGSVFRIEEQFDNRYVFVPLSFALDLFAYGNKRTALELKLNAGVDVKTVKEALHILLGPSFLVQDSDEQHASLLRILKIEKLFVFLALAFIVVIASFNIFVSLSMLVLDKRRDITLLKAIGAGKHVISRIFMLEGAFIAFSGAFAGMAAGFLVCFLQQQFGIVSMGMESAAINAYPVKMQLFDFLSVGALVVLLTLLAGLLPAKRAAETGGR